MTSDEARTAEMIQAMEGVLNHIGRALGVTPGDVPGLLSRVEDLVDQEKRWQEHHE